MLRLRTFGGLSIESDSGPLTGAATQRRPLALLALLAVAGERGLDRDRVCLYLWPDSTPQRARNVLKQTLYALRRDLRAPDLLVTGEPLQLNPAVLSSDLGEFEGALGRGELSRAVELHRAPFLEAFHLTESPEFEQWREGERTRLGRRFAEAIAALAECAMDAGDSPRAVELWRRAAVADPLDPHAAVGMIGALAASGDRSAALQHARVYETLVRSQLGRDPDPAVTALVEHIRSTGPRSSAPQLVISEAAETAPSTEDLPRAGLARRSPLGWWLPMSAVVLVLAIGVAAQLARHRFGQAKPDPHLLVVAPFQVLDSHLELWEEGLVDVLSRDLDGAGPLRTVAPSVAIRRWRGRPDPGSAAELARRTGAGLALFGSVLSSGRDSVRVTATLVDAATGNVVGVVERRDGLDRMDRLTDSLAVGVLRELEQRRSLAVAHSASLGSTTSLEALKAFLRGEQFYRRSRWDSAVAYYQHAISYDTGFVLALRRVGNVLSWQRLTQDSLSLSYLLRAGAQNRRLAPRDSLLVAADSQSAGAGLAESTIDQWRHTRRLFATLAGAAQLYPETPGVWFALGEAGYHFGTGPVIGVQENQILAAFDSAIGLDPVFAPAYIHAVELALNVHGLSQAMRYARAYLALNPMEPTHRGIRLVMRLVGTEATSPHELERLLDTVRTEALVSARTILRRWPDSAESAVRLGRLLAAGRPSSYPLFSDTAFMGRRLAEQLAFRGHLREAYQVLGRRALPIFAELAYLGAVPAESAAAVFARWGKEGSAQARLALTWWTVRGDLDAIRRLRVRGVRQLRAGPTEDARLAARYDTAAAGAHLSLAQGDTTDALMRFLALPDTLCLDCYLDRLVKARLLTMRGREPEAFAILQEPLVAFLTPIEVIFALERARLAERLGEQESALRDYRFVAAAWAKCDPELRSYVAEARLGLERVIAAELSVLRTAISIPPTRIVRHQDERRTMAVRFSRY